MNGQTQGTNWPILIATLAGTSIVLYEYFSVAPRNKAIREAEENKRRTIEQQNKEAAQTYTFHKMRDGRITRTYTVNLYTLAAQIYDALHGSMFTEDEERVISLLMDITPAYMRRLALCYREKYSKDLRSDLVRYLSNAQQDRIRTFINAL